MDERSELDRRIRDLVGRAVADAPPSPAIDGETLTTRADPASTSRWLLVGMTGLSIAAGLVAILLFARPDEATAPMVPATLPSTTVATTTDTSPGSTPDTTPSSTPTSLADSTPTPTSTSTTEPVAQAPTLSRVAVAAGPNGVTVTGADGNESVVTGEPMAVAFVDGVGRVFMQRSDAPRDPEADTTILVSDPESGIVEPLRVPDELAGAVRLHGLTDIDGAATLLVETSPGNCAGFENCDGALWAFRSDEGTATELDRMSVWEAGWSRLHIADSGMVVGTIFSEASSALYSTSLTGAAPVDPLALGLEEWYYDCSNCPSSFSIDPGGTRVVWLEWDIETFQHTLVVTPIDGSTTARTLLVDPDGSVCCLDGAGPGMPVEPSLTGVDLVADGVGLRGRIFVNESSGGDRRSPVTVDLPTGTVTVRSDLVTTTTFGTIATFGTG